METEVTFEQVNVQNLAHEVRTDHSAPLDLDESLTRQDHAVHHGQPGRFGQMIGHAVDLLDASKVGNARRYGRQGVCGELGERVGTMDQERFGRKMELDFAVQKKVVQDELGAQLRTVNAQGGDGRTDEQLSDGTREGVLGNQAHPHGAIFFTGAP